jgi:hypothetical protein
MTQRADIQGERTAHAPLTARIRNAGRRMNAHFLAVFAAALIAFTWQSFVTQTHIHPDTLPAAAAHVSGMQLAPTQPAPERPIDCPICHAAAIGGHYLTPGPMPVLAAIAVSIWRFAAIAPVASVVTRSHGWRSRAPPAARA